MSDKLGVFLDAIYGPEARLPGNGTYREETAMTADEAALRAYTVALSYVQSRDRDTAILLLQAQIAFYRPEVESRKQTKRRVRRAQERKR